MEPKFHRTGPGQRSLYTLWRSIVKMWHTRKKSCWPGAFGAKEQMRAAKRRAMMAPRPRVIMPWNRGF